MAHFAQLDHSSVVTNVIVVGNPDCCDENGVEQEQLGIAFCRSLFGADTEWRQTSYNRRIRKNFAGIGYSYDAQRDAFIPPQPFASWLLDEDTCTWVAPIPMPEDGSFYDWDETTGDWVAIA